MMTAKQFLHEHRNDAESIDAAKTIDAFVAEMRAGQSGKSSSLAMLPSYLYDRAPEVRGGKRYIVIDAGGTNFRSAVGRFDGDRAVMEDMQTTAMPATYGRMTADEFYSATARNIARLLPHACDIGFCFSFPMRTTSDGDGVITVMPKGVDAPETVGTRVAERTLAALRMVDPTPRRAVVLNDTVATLLSVPKTYECARIGYIYGTGTNICFADADGMIVNTECGNFDKFERGDFEACAALRTPSPDSYVFEKVTAGKYLAGVIASAFNAAADEGVIGSCAALNDGFTLADVSAFLCGDGGALSAAFESDTDRATAAEIASGIVDRAAKLGATVNAAAAMAIGDKRVQIVAEGTTFEKLCGYRGAFERHLKAIVEPRGIGFDILRGNGNLCGALTAVATTDGMVNK